jgi:negative regulator of sigma E activity
MKSWRKALGLAMGLWWGSALPLAAALTPPEMLRRAGIEGQRVAHTGRLQVTVYQANGTALTSEVRVEADGQGRERREYLSGPARGLVVLTDGKQEWRREPGAATWMALPLTLETASMRQQRLDRLFRNYQVERVKTEAVVGRTAQVLRVTPRYPGNPSRTFWIDAQTFLPLRTDQFNCDGRLHTNSRYTQLNLKPPEAPRLRPPPPAQVVQGPLSVSLRPRRSAAEVEQATGHTVHLPKEVPPGYELTGYYVRYCRQGVYLPVLRYSDGLNLLTVFENRPQAQGRGRGRGWRWRRGQDWECQFQETLQQKVVRVLGREHSYLLIGDHDRRALQRMAESIR